MPDCETQNAIALWVITANGLRLARKLAVALDSTHIYCSDSLTHTDGCHAVFDRLSKTVVDTFGRYSGHVFFMSTGITVRIIAPLIQKKTTDPAVVVVDDAGKSAVSLLSGHIGGANRLTHTVAAAVGATPVITTATDVNHLPAIDVLAMDKGLTIENPEAIRYVSMAFLRGDKIVMHDPNGYMPTDLPGVQRDTLVAGTVSDDTAAIYVDDIVQPFPEGVLILRPPSLKAGIGCNRGTDTAEIRDLLFRVMEENRLAISSLAGLASIDIKSDETGLIRLSRELGLSIDFFSKTELNHAVGIRSSSAAAQKHVGVKSVCEAAAILTSRNGQLIVPKNKTANATVAIARTGSISSA